MSSNHALVSVKNGKIYIEDLESTNGTVLNGKNIEDIEEIQVGDTIEIGMYNF